MSSNLQSNKTFFVRIKKKKPDAQSCEHQALKNISKAVKIAKTFLVQKLTRCLKEIEGDCLKKTELLEKVATIKKSDHNEIGVRICKKIFANDESSVIEYDDIFQKEIVNHKKVLETISIWKIKKESVDKELKKMLKKKLKKKKQSKQVDVDHQYHRKQYREGAN